MNEVKWLTCEDPNPMLACIRGKGSPRKLRLFACACCRQVIWHLLLDERSRQAVTVAERFADGLAGEAELQAASRLASEVVAAETWGTRTYWVASAVAATANTDWPAEVLAHHAPFGAYASGEPKRVGMARRSKAVRDRQQEARTAVRADKAKEAALLRCIFPDPFRGKPVIDPAWLAWNDGIVRRLAEEVYQERVLPAGTFDPIRLGVLADALEECGADAELVAHLRGPGPHVRGCFVVDLLLGKS